MEIHRGNRVKMKKIHPCGCNTFLVMRAGMEFKIRCDGCGREILLTRKKLEHNIKAVLQEPDNSKD